MTLEQAFGSTTRRDAGSYDRNSKERKGHGTHHRRPRCLAYADDRFCLRPEQARRSRVGTDRRELRPAIGLARGEAPRRAAVDLQRPRYVVLLRSLLGVRAWRRARM